MIPGTKNYPPTFSGFVRRLGVCFSTTEFITPLGEKIEIVSDGRGGGGFSHWRELRKDGKLVGSLTDEGNATVKVCSISGDLRNPDSVHRFETLEDAVSFLVNVNF